MDDPNPFPRVRLTTGSSSMVEHSAWDREVGGSSPLSQI